jgi:hypothetical protein
MDLYGDIMYIINIIKYLILKKTLLQFIIFSIYSTHHHLSFKSQ